MRIFRSQGAEGLYPGFAEVDFSAAVIVDAGVAAQSEGIHVKTFDKSFPFTDLDPCFSAFYDAVFDNGDIGRRAAHVDHDGIGGVGQGAGTDHTGGRTAEQCLHRALRRECFRHL